MKILFIDHDSGFSGSTISMEYLLSYWLKKNYNIVVLSLKQKRETDMLNIEGFNGENIRFIHFSSFLIKSWSLDIHFTDSIKYSGFSSFKNILFLIIKSTYAIIYSFYLISSIKPDIVYSNEFVSSAFLIVPSVLGIKTVCHVRGRLIDPHVGSGMIRMIAERMIINFSESVFCITKIEKDQFTCSSKDDKLKILIVPEFLKNSDFIHSDSENENKKITILMAGGISKLKGSLEFIKSLKLLYENDTDFNAIIAGKIYNGTREEKEYCELCYKEGEILISELKLKIVSDIDRRFLFNEIDILVCANTQSHFSRPIIEAWAKKTAVIAIKNDHNCQLIENHFNGIIYNGNTFELFMELKKYILNNDLRKSLVQNGHTYAKNNFNYLEILDKTRFF